ncbi:hypothetical protein SRHO_G00276520 [Serrasalmus rhombeus]
MRCALLLTLGGSELSPEQHVHHLLQRSWKALILRALLGGCDLLGRAKAKTGEKIMPAFPLVTNFLQWPCPLLARLFRTDMHSESEADFKCIPQAEAAVLPLIVGVI